MREVVERARAEVVRGHALVAHGSYPEALAAFLAARASLVDALGADHPEVQELDEDVEAVREMAGVAAFAAELGLGGPSVAGAARPLPPVAGRGSTE